MKYHVTCSIAALSVLACQASPEGSEGVVAGGAPDDPPPISILLDDDPEVVEEYEYERAHPLSPFVRLKASFGCPDCSGSFAEPGAGLALTNRFGLEVSALDGGAVRPVRITAGDAPWASFWQLTPMRHYVLTITPPEDVAIEPYALEFSTGWARSTVDLAVDLRLGRALARGPGAFFATSAEGVVVGGDAKGNMVRADAGGAAPFGVAATSIAPRLGSAFGARFAPGGELLVSTRDGVRVVDPASWVMRDGVARGARLDVTPSQRPWRDEAGVEVTWWGDTSVTASATARRLMTATDTPGELLVFGWDGEVTEVARLSGSDAVSTRGFTLSGDGRFAGRWAGGVATIDALEPGAQARWGFEDGTTRAPMGAWLRLGHDGQTAYVLGREGAQGCPGSCDVLVNGRLARVGVDAFAVSASRPGAVMITRIDGEVQVQAHVPGRVDIPATPQLGGYDVSASPVTGTLLPCSDSAYENDVLMRRFEATDETLIIQDGQTLAALDAATGEVLAQLPGAWACYPREDGSVVLRTAESPGERRFGCAPGQPCRLIELSPGMEVVRDVDLLAEGLPLESGALSLHPACGVPGGASCGQAVLTGEDGRSRTTGASEAGADAYSGSPTRHLGATCLAFVTEAGGLNCVR